MTGADTTVSPTTFVLVHGAFQDATVWASVIAELQNAGHTAVAVTLPGRQPDPTSPTDVTLAAHRDAVLAVVREQGRPVGLVGHSFGGIVISEVAEAEPSLIDELVYVAAYLPRAGDSLAGLAEEDADKDIDDTNFLFADDYSYAYIAEDQFARLFCEDGDESQRSRVLASRNNEPLGPLNEPSNVTDARFGRVAKRYVTTQRDRVVSPMLQHLMVARTPVATVHAIDSGHSPFITDPVTLAAIIGTRPG
jgi:pimeloyl-ACP methyl ester carboxylesterase